MRRLILQTGISIDGYVAALDGSHPWNDGGGDEAVKRWILDSVSAAGAHFMGRVTYQDMASVWPKSTSVVRAPDERDPEGRLLEDVGARQLARDAHRRAAISPRRSSTSSASRGTT